MESGQRQIEVEKVMAISCRNGENRRKLSNARLTRAQQAIANPGVVIAGVG
jgi:hypothetical protein